MNRFAELLDRLSYEPSRNNKLRLMADYFGGTPDPERGFALAALTGALTFQHAKPGMIRALISERTDPVLFELSHDYVGDLSETVALMWPAPPASLGARLAGVPGAAQHEAPQTSLRSLRKLDCVRNDALQTRDRYELRVSNGPGSAEHHSRKRARAAPRPGHDGLNRAPMGAQPTLSEVVTALSSLGKAALPGQLARWLDQLDETGRWALLKLVTGALRIGVSARLAKTAAAALGEKDAQEVELIWSGLRPPYVELFAWLEGRADKPESHDPAPFRPAMLAHALEDGDLSALDPRDFIGEWKWDGIRVQAVAGVDEHGRMIARLYSRTGEDISGGFPDLLAALRLPGAIDGELLVVREGRVASFNVLQQRLNRKAVNAKLLAEFPAHLRSYDLLVDGSEDLRVLAFSARRRRLEDFVARLDHPRVDLSPAVPFTTWDDLAAARANPAAAGAGDDAGAVEGVMLKRRDAPYVPGRPKGPWWKWKRDPFIVDTVLMYAQRGHGKRSSYYSDYTFGVWTKGEDGDVLVPVGKAYFGFTDEELIAIDRFVRRNTVERFGPVREVVHEADQGLVLEVAFDGLARSIRHKSGLAMRFPRINRLRWDKPPGEADRLETLEGMLQRKPDAAAQQRRIASRDGMIP
jgi:ATP-dependent DNA ligase